MNRMSTLTILALAGLIAILPGCDNKPADDIPAATTNTAPAQPAEAPAAEAAPAEAPAAEAAPAEAPAEAPMEEAPAAETAPAAAAGEPATYAVVPNDVNTLAFTGYKITGKKQGGWAEYAGTVELTDGTIESAKINMTFTMNSLFTSAKLLTETLYDEVWFNVDKFPEATFVSTQVEKTGDDYTVTGDLTIRGTTTNISFPAKIQIDGDQLKTQAQFKLLRSSWGMTDTGVADDLIEDEVVIEFDIVADKV